MQTIWEEKQVAEMAIETLQRETGLQITYEHCPAGNVDGFLRIPDADVELAVEVKRWAERTNPGVLINRVKAMAGPGCAVLIADYINPNLAEKLKIAGIQYLDAAGNAYLYRRPLYIWIAGKKQNRQPRELETQGRAFQPTGLKVIYEFLKNEGLVNAPYREIAEQANIALGAVGWVIKDLVNQGFILEGEKKRRRLTKHDALLDKWIEHYPQKLRKKLFLGNFTTDDEVWWHRVDPCDYGAVWGGEVAAERYTNYLNPQDGIVYIPKESMPLFLKDARLRRPQEFERPNINIELYEPFGAIVENATGLADPILVYADLVATGDPRNIETAQKLREKYID
jgi:hypothetical protein